ncbi:MAG TPA: hypothetical protein VJ183_06225 [Chloroflexia bacterium]|nr:hypothetical protein [Chloroflexia bacterium]
MTDRHIPATDDLRATRNHTESTQQTEHDASTVESSDTQAVYPGSLLGNIALRQRGNSTVRAAVMQQAQRLHGNRAVQRFMQSQNATNSIPVQRSPGGLFGGGLYDPLDRSPLGRIGCPLPLGLGCGGGRPAGKEDKTPTLPAKKGKAKAKPPVKTKPQRGKPKKETEGKGNRGGLPLHILLPGLGRDRNWPYGGPGPISGW